MRQNSIGNANGNEEIITCVSCFLFQKTLKSRTTIKQMVKASEKWKIAKMHFLENLSDLLMERDY